MILGGRLGSLGAAMFAISGGPIDELPLLGTPRGGRFSIGGSIRRPRRLTDKEIKRRQKRKAQNRARGITKARAAR